MKIRAITADLFCFDGDLDWCHPVSIRLEFVDDTVFRLRCASDGESIVIDDRALDGPVDMAECGRIEVRDLADRLTISVPTLDIKAVKKIIDENNLTVGVALMDSDGPILCVWNYGDELQYGSFALMAEQHDWGGRPEISSTALSLR